MEKNYKILSIIFDEGVTTITAKDLHKPVNYAELKDEFKNITSITIPESVTEIGEGAFAYSPNLTLQCTKGSYAESYAIKHNIPCVTTKNSKSKSDYEYDT